MRGHKVLFPGKPSSPGSASQCSMVNATHRQRRQASTLARKLLSCSSRWCGRTARFIQSVSLILPGLSWAVSLLLPISGRSAFRARCFTRSYCLHDGALHLHICVGNWGRGPVLILTLPVCLPVCLTLPVSDCFMMVLLVPCWLCYMLLPRL